MKYKIKRNYTKLGKNLKDCRNKAGLTQKNVADRLGYSSAQFISNFERGIAAPPVKRIRVLAKIYYPHLDKKTVVEMYVAGIRKRIESVI